VKSTYDPSFGAMSFWYAAPGPAAERAVVSEEIRPGIVFDLLEETDQLVGFEILDTEALLAEGAALPVPASALAYDAMGDVMHLDFVPRAGATTLKRSEVYPNIDLWTDQGDRIVAIDVRNASRALAPGSVARVAAE
jgi:hypothetical protein